MDKHPFSHSLTQVQIVLIDSDNEKVSKGRARIEAVDKVISPYMLFLSADTVPASEHFIGE